MLIFLILYPPFENSTTRIAIIAHALNYVHTYQMHVPKLGFVHSCQKIFI